ncbi:DsbA family protein [Pseudomonas aeruginosa]|uniref:DsbA family protein n=1 Tax=Pseudomonas aeruginosa TaxID=287 RepID=UPI001E636E5F|nr:thioredoxin domain-containing protein [Pseudomonas aeruginosa]MCC9289617.1 thioredoxin domain-containing protein [Pseudomonas aeruginosa]UVN18866.1 Protein-disulfide isomerase [Pseudomonas aeruginosa]
MPKFNATLGTAIAVSILTSAVAIAVSVHMRQTYTHIAVQNGLVEQLPAAVDQTLNDREVVKINAAIAIILWKCSGAAHTTNEARHNYGTKDAQITLVEIVDLECPNCKRYHDTPMQMTDQSEGRIIWVWQHYRLAYHKPAAELAAHASEYVAEVAGNQAFCAFTGECFARTHLNGQRVDDVQRHAQEVRAPLEAYRQCLDSGKYPALFEAQVMKGTDMAVTGRPASVVVENLTGNKLLVKAAQSTQELLQTLQQLVKLRDEAPNLDKLDTPAERATNEIRAQ